MCSTHCVLSVTSAFCAANLDNNPSRPRCAPSRLDGNLRRPDGPRARHCIRPRPSAQTLRSTSSRQIPASPPAYMRCTRYIVLQKTTTLRDKQSLPHAHRGCTIHLLRTHGWRRHQFNAKYEASVNMKVNMSQCDGIVSGRWQPNCPLLVVGDSAQAICTRLNASELNFMVWTVASFSQSASVAYNKHEPA